MGTKIFRYKTLRKVIFLIIMSAVTCIHIVAVRQENLLEYRYLIIPVEVRKVMLYVFIMLDVYMVIKAMAMIYTHTKCQFLIIEENEIIYMHGWILKETTTIFPDKISICSKTTNILQKWCGCLDIYITVMGRNSCIYIPDIEEGQKAYDLIIEMIHKR